MISVSRHGAERALERLSITPEAFQAWAEATRDGWCEMSDEYFKVRGVDLQGSRNEASERRVFRCPWDTRISLGIVVANDSVIVTVVPYREDNLPSHQVTGNFQTSFQLETKVQNQREQINRLERKIQRLTEELERSRWTNGSQNA